MVIFRCAPQLLIFLCWMYSHWIVGTAPYWIYYRQPELKQRSWELPPDGWFSIREPCWIGRPFENNCLHINHYWYLDFAFTLELFPTGHPPSQLKNLSNNLCPTLTVLHQLQHRAVAVPMQWCTGSDTAPAFDNPHLLVTDYYLYHYRAEPGRLHQPILERDIKTTHHNKSTASYIYPLGFLIHTTFVL